MRRVGVALCLCVVLVVLVATAQAASYLFLMNEVSGEARVYAVNGSSLGELVKSYYWSGGWTTASPYSVGVNRYLFLLKEGDGTVHIHRLNADGTVGDQTYNAKWSTGWTTAEFFTMGGTTYLFLLKRSDGSVHIQPMSADGSVAVPLGETKWDYDWSSGWTTARLFTMGATTYLFLLKSGNGSVDIHPMNWDGTVGDRKWDYDWSDDWTTAEFFTAGSKPFLFCQKSGTTSGRTTIDHVEWSGAIASPPSYDQNWGSGYALHRFFYYEDTPKRQQVTCLLSLKSNGVLEIRKMETKSAGGTVTATPGNPFFTLALGSAGWTSAEFYSVFPPFEPQAGQYYRIVNVGSGRCLDVHSVTETHNGMDKGANVQQWEWLGGDNQQWQFIPTDDGYYKIISKRSQKCLDVHSDAQNHYAMDDGANVYQWDYVGGTNQQWAVLLAPDDSVLIVSKRSGKCLEVAGSSLWNGGNVQQGVTTALANQRWQLLPVTP